MNLDDTVTQWLVSKAVTTRVAYRRDVTDLLMFAGVRSVAGLTGDDLAGWRASLDDRELSSGSRARALSAARSFLKWCRAVGDPSVDHGLSTDAVNARLGQVRVVVERPTAELNTREAGALLSAASLSGTRDLALVAVLVGVGLRRAEVAALDVRWFAEDDDGSLTVRVLGKGGKVRHLPVGDDVAALVRAYLVESGRGLTSPGPLFLSRDRVGGNAGGRLSVSGVGVIVARLAAAAGVSGDWKRVTTHSLRHTFAMRALRAGANVESVRQLLGHASIATTQRYLHSLGAGHLRRSVPPLPVLRATAVE